MFPEAGENIPSFSSPALDMLAAAIGVFCSLLLLMICLWIWRYCELLCWGFRTVVRSDTEQEGAPPPRLRASTTSSKDLPPAYHTLFPETSKCDASLV
ncbi:hypothetical protein J6590_060050 [Homalodisca vitripennis]|nr:hypothetical protein J6590_060050 [Homalodisca vitripennis]